MSNYRMKSRSRLLCRSVEPLFLLLRTQEFLCCNIVVNLVLFSMFSVCCGYKEQKFAMEPQDQTAVIGSRVTLPCRVENKAGQLQWTKDDFGLGLHRDLSGYDRYKMIGSDEEGDYSLDIRDVTLEDDAKYQCQVSSGAKGEPPIRSRYAHLTILVPPENPKITQGNLLSTHEDTKVVLECISVGGKPPAEITWVDGNAGVLTQGVSYTVQQLSDGQRFTAKSVLKFSPKEEHHNQTFTCQAQNTADRAYRSASILLHVKYSPKIKIVKKGKMIKGKIAEGENVTLECTAHANPSNMTFKWFLNDRFVVADKIMVIENVSREHHGATVKCEVNNQIGKSEETSTLAITYPPKFRSNPQDVEADAGTSTILSCDVDSYPEPNIEWTHLDDQNIKVGRTANLTLYADTHTRGSYVCRASVEGYPTIEAIVHLFIKGPPKILSNQTQYGSHGDTTKIECAAFSVPKLDSIVWTFDGRDIDTFHDQDFAFQEDILQGGIVNSTLIIRESQSKHFGTYRCNVTNEYGSDIMEIVLKPNRSFPLLFILFGITMSTMVVATLIMLVIICHRKQRNNKQNRTPKKPDVTVTAEELYKENDRNSNISDLKLELRQANGNCEIDYSNTGSDSTLCSNAKLGSGVPLAGSVGMSSINKGYQAYRYNNDYADPAFVDYKPNGYSSGYETFVHYGQEYNPGSLRVQSPNSSDKLTPNRSINGSLPRSADSASTVMMIQGNGSQNNSLQRPLGKKRNGSIADMNNIGIAANDVNRIANGCLISGVDVRYAATYGNPHLRAGGGLTFPAQVNTAKPASTPAPPPYSSVRNSVILPTGQSSHSITSPTSVASPQCAMSPITTSTVSADSTQQQMGIPTSSATPQSPSGHYIVAPSSRTLSNASVTRKGNFHQTPLATHV